jgi:hypothetical protein
MVALFLRWYCKDQPPQSRRSCFSLYLKLARFCASVLVAVPSRNAASVRCMTRFFMVVVLVCVLFLPLQLFPHPLLDVVVDHELQLLRVQVIVNQERLFAIS